MEGKVLYEVEMLLEKEMIEMQRKGTNQRKVYLFFLGSKSERRSYVYKI